MPKLKLLFLTLLTLAIVSCRESKNNMEIDNLKCEYIGNPIGIDSPEPRFTWQLSSDKTGVKQTAFEILVGTDSLEVLSGMGNQWNSGKINSGLTLASYSSKSLMPFTTYFWNVKIWDENGVASDWSMEANWSMGFLNFSDWNGKFIYAS